MTLRARKVSGAFVKRAPGLKPRDAWSEDERTDHEAMVPSINQANPIFVCISSF